MSQLEYSRPGWDAGLSLWGRNESDASSTQCIQAGNFVLFARLGYSAFGAQETLPLNSLKGLDAPNTTFLAGVVD